ncbi:MAG: hypothetical protein NTX38_14350 [Methylobacter sp.]|nr:hypothetical protein [Methylobacter sp.]
MKKLNIATLFLLTFVFTGVVSADITLKSATEVEGTWKLESSKNSLNDKDAVKREDTWIFKDGKVTILHIPRDGKYYDQPPVNYEIEDGKLKIALLGNSRFDIFSLIEIADKNMTLKGKFGGYYYFIKK